MTTACSEPVPHPSARGSASLSSSSVGRYECVSAPFCSRQPVRCSPSSSSLPLPSPSISTCSWSFDPHRVPDPRVHLSVGGTDAYPPPSARHSLCAARRRRHRLASARRHVRHVGGNRLLKEFMTDRFAHGWRYGCVFVGCWSRQLVRCSPSSSSPRQRSPSYSTCNFASAWKTKGCAGGTSANAVVPGAPPCHPHPKTSKRHRGSSVLCGR